MHRLLILTVLLVSTIDAGLIKIPKIYNALISSDENLSPSHTYPIVEPVLRTTALGVAFPPLLANPPIRKGVEDSEKKEATSSQSTVETNKKDEVEAVKNQPVPQLSYHGTLYPLAFDPYLSYAYSNDFLFPALPYYEHPVFVDLNHFKNAHKMTVKEEETKPAINFKKNSDIPDVPPPPLPVNQVDKKEKQ